MAIPLILAGIAGLAGAAGGIHGAIKMKEANDTIKEAKKQHEQNISHYELQNKMTCSDMDRLGKKELEICKSFEKFSDVFKKIHSKPEFKEYRKDNICLPKYDEEELNDVSIGAGILLGGLGGAAIGTAGGFAAAGATTSAVMALGTASTGTAIASLSGAAATNATLAALGGGALAAGGGGVALGTTVLGAATLGVGLLVGGIIFNVTGSKLSDKADEAYSQMKKAEENINKICQYLKELSDISLKYYESVVKVNMLYERHLRKLKNIIEVKGKLNWNEFTAEERLITENTVNLVALLNKMCKVALVKQSDNNDINKINYSEADKSMSDAIRFLNNID